MRFSALDLPGAFLIGLERHEDERGSFARTFCRGEFEARGLNPHVEQSNLSVNPRRGTLRGMHWQAAPHEEAKLVRVARGAIYDVLVDLRPDSPRFRRWCSIELTASSGDAVYVPERVAHGFLTLEDDTEVVYNMSAAYHPESGRGVRWDDPAFEIEWPFPPRVISERDAGWPDFEVSP
ncbi:MAG: dTDP-4-dehydrorhamnose 3,5-epimerase [Thermoanaerobaculia bacterium]